MKTTNQLNEAIENIVAFLNAPGDKSPLAQASLVLETVQVAINPEDDPEALKNLVDFLDSYVNTFAIRTDETVPEFAKGIIYNNRNVTIADITKLLARLRCLSVTQKHSDYIIKHLSYFIDRFGSEYGASPITGKKFHVAYSDYGESIKDLLHWALKACTPPVHVTFNSKDEWKSFRQVTENERRYVCEFAGAKHAETFYTEEIDNFGDSKFPLEVRVRGVKKMDERLLITHGLQFDEELTLKEFLKKHRKKVIIIAIALIAIIAPTVIIPIVEENRRVKEELEREINDQLRETYERNQAIQNEYPDSWMVGTWKGSSQERDMYNNIVNVFCDLTIDKYGNATQYTGMKGYPVDVEQFTLRYDRSTQQLYFRDGGMRVTYKVNPNTHTISTGNMTLRKAN